MKELKFDFNNMFGFAIGKTHGVTDTDIRKLSAITAKAIRHLKDVLSSKDARINLGLEWAHLPFQSQDTISQIQNLGNGVAKRYKNVISLGIGGSYLGIKAAQDVLCAPYYNEFSSLRNRRPKIYFEGNNLDPEPLNVLLANLDPRETCVIVISKSGETTETKAAFTVIEKWLKRKAGKKYGRQIIAITDPLSGTLRAKVNKESTRDRLSFRSLPVLKGVGGRYSELNIGLLHLAIVGIDINEVLAGARMMAKRCASAELFENPAYLYALLQTILYRNKGKTIAVMMPFAETLRSTADWYSQLLAESLGKKYARKIKTDAAGREMWGMDTAKIVNVGRTPLPCRGTNDLHSIQQNNIEGENNKTVTFIKVEKFRSDIRIASTNDLLSGKFYSKLLALAEEATEWALVRESRPNCTIIIPDITPYHWGELIFFFEMATAFEGELLGINAFDQPGVEGYKNYMYYKLRKPGLSKEISSQIRKTPLIKKQKYII